MNDISPKQRFLDICHFKRPGDLCLLTSVNELQDETPGNWVEQGAPQQILNAEFRQDYFQFTTIRRLTEIRSGGSGLETNIDLGHGIVARAGYVPVVPGFEPRIIEEDEHFITYVNRSGQTCRKLKAKRYGMPMYLDWPVKDWATWNEYKKHLDPNTPERWPADWDAYVQEMNGRPEPLSLNVGSFFGVLREWVGLERLLYMFYDDPSLIEDMMEQMLYLGIEVIKRTLKDIKIQEAKFWEDMCYKAGPLISPAMVEKFMVPRYKKICDLLHSHGVDVIYLDSDGNVEQLIPLWLEAGINLISPFEVAAGNDAIAIRRKYGKNLIIAGAIDKRPLAQNKKAIREEVMSKVPFLLEQGGYLPSVDHSVPPNIPFENYCYFINTMREVAGLEKLSF